MSTTAQQALDLAIQRSSLNNPDLVAPAQIIRYIADLEKAVYILAAKLNPDFFGLQDVTGTRAAFGDSWDINTTPGGIGSNTIMEVKTIVGTVTNVAVGDRINLISRRWPQFTLAPRAFIRSKKLYAYNDELGAADANMVTVVDIFYAEIPSGPTALGTTLSIPDEWIGLVYLPLAKNLALRDQRPDELPAIDEEYKVVLAMFGQHVGVYDGGVTRPLQSVPVPTALDQAGG